jgi:hypothetical protein
LGGDTVFFEGKREIVWTVSEYISLPTSFLGARTEYVLSGIYIKS